MNPSSFDTVFLLLLFFLPGYVYSTVKGNFKYLPDDKVEIRLLSFLFSSLICQVAANIALAWFFGLHTTSLITDTNTTLRTLVANNLSLIFIQVITAIAFAVVTAILLSLKQLDRTILWVLNKTRMSRFLELGFRKAPPIIGAIEANTNFGQFAIGCVIELDDGRHFEGDIRHVGYGENTTDYVVVLSRVITLTNDGHKKVYPPELKLLIPYKNIKTIFYKEYPTAQNVVKQKATANKRHHVMLPYWLIVPYLVLLIAVQNSFQRQNFLLMLIELLGSFVVTFLGVFASYSYSKKLEKESSDAEKQDLYTSSLELIASEMSLNEQTLQGLKEGITTMPHTLTQLASSYDMLIAVAKDIQTKAFYGLISSGGMQEITKNHDIFNAIQQSYYNLQKTISGLHSSREVFREYHQLTTIPQVIAKQAETIIAQESDKIERGIGMTTKGIKLIVKELKQYDIVFTDKSDTSDTAVPIPKR